MDQKAAFDNFKERCANEGLLTGEPGSKEDDIHTGIYDDATLLRFIRARNYDVEGAFQQYKATRTWRDANQLIALYESIDVSDYDETRKMYTHWIGRRDRSGSPVCIFEIKQLTPDIMAAYDKSCASKPRGSTSTETEAMLRLFCINEYMIRFVHPLCSAILSRPEPSLAVTKCTCIIDISGVSLMQFWRLRSHMQAASVLATSYYPETLGKTYIIGAPSFFSTIWGWISKWFDQNTISKISIVPYGKELSMLSEAIDPVNIPLKYGGKFQYEFGMLPNLDSDVQDIIRWKGNDDDETNFQEMPKGPMRWITSKDGMRTGIAVGTVDSIQRHVAVMNLA